MDFRRFRPAPQWVAMGVFWLSWILSVLDRQLLAAVAPSLKEGFRLSNAQLGQLISGFYLAYAAATPLSGWMVDRLGLRLSAAIATTVWSLAGAATALTRSFGGLVACRLGLGIGELPFARQNYRSLPGSG